MKEKKKNKYELPITRYLLYLVISTTFISGVSLSRYSATKQSVSISSVAHFEVEISHNPWFIDEYNEFAVLDPDGSREFFFTFKNKGEVSTKMRVINAVTDTPMVSGEYTLKDINDNQVTLDTNGWFYLSPTGTSGDTLYANGYVAGAPYSNTVIFYFEYEQVD